MPEYFKLKRLFATKTNKLNFAGVDDAYRKDMEDCKSFAVKAQEIENLSAKVSELSRKMKILHKEIFQKLFEFFKKNNETKQDKLEKEIKKLLDEGKWLATDYNKTSEELKSKLVKYDVDNFQPEE